MKEEELEKEAKQSYLDNTDHIQWDAEGEFDYTRGYINAAEPRENRIAELEDKLKHAEENCINKTCVVFKDKEDCVAHLLELEKENEQLKKNEFNARTCLELQQSQDKAIVQYMGDQLAQAKEIIKELVRVEYADFTDGDYSKELSKVLEQAEQFIKEIKENEKIKN